MGLGLSLGGGEGSSWDMGDVVLGLVLSGGGGDDGYGGGGDDGYGGGGDWSGVEWWWVGVLGLVLNDVEW